MDWIRDHRKRLIPLGLVSALICASILIIGLRCSNKTNPNCRCEFPFLRNVKVDPDRVLLVLTPYIQHGQISTARRLSYVGNWKGVESYSGLLTVNESFDAHLFFWFFPSETKSNSIPLVLYLQGGPSLSSLLGLFLESGPFKVTKVDDKFELHKNEYSWTKLCSMLFIDSPVGTGFSRANSSDAYAANQEDVGRDLYTALLQFFILFPELRSSDFYVMGTSYAAKYIPTIAHKIHLENGRNPIAHINLKGLAIGSGYFHFEGLVSGAVSTFYHNIGFLDESQRASYAEAERVHGEYYQQRNFSKARQIISARRFLHLYAGYNNFLGGSALQMTTPPLHFQDFLNHDCIQTALHVGQKEFSLLSLQVFDKFEDQDYMTSAKSQVEQLLDANYRILLYNAQFDVIIPHTVVESFVANLSWSGAAEFARANRLLWVVGAEIAGFVTETNSSRLTMLMMRNSGHTACSDQPAWCFDMINRFLNKDSFTAFFKLLEFLEDIR